MTKIRYGYSENCEHCKWSFTKDKILICAATIKMIQPKYRCEKFKIKRG